MERSRSWIRLMMVALAGVLAVATPARSHDSIDPGETIKDTLSREEITHEYRFDGDEDDYVTILLLDVDDKDDFRPTIQLSGPRGTIAMDSDSQCALIRSYRLREDGEYSITVSGATLSFFDDEEYDYVLSLISTGDTNDGGVITYGQTIQAAISPDGDLDGYQFHGHDGDHVTIRVTNTSGNSDFTPFVDLVGPDGFVDDDSDDHVAEIHKTLDESGDYTIIVWGGEDEWEGGTYELFLTGPGVVPTPTPTPIPTPTPVPLPDLTISQADASPAAPTRLKPGDPMTLGAFVDNLGQPAEPFWLEFWGSRTGGLTLDAFLADSQYVSGLGVLASYPFEAARALYNIPDGPWSVVMVVDRPGMIGEWNEGNNRFVVPGKRVLVLRPQANVDLVVEGVGVNPMPPQAGHVTNFSGAVRNAGAQNSGSFWIEFWRSGTPVFPQFDNMICDSIFIGDLAPGGSINLGAYPRAIYSGVPLDGQIGVFADRPDTVNETDETNNFQFVGGNPHNPSGQTDLQVAAADFSPAAPAEVLPGSNITLSVDLANMGSHETGAFWLEFWGSRTGGLTLDAFLCDSLAVSSLAAGQSIHYPLTRPLYAIPDGPYSVVVVADRIGQVSDSEPLNNRRVIVGKKLLVIRPQTQANPKIEGFAFGSSNAVMRGAIMPLSGIVRNTGSQAAGPFWIEFWASRDQQYPTLDWFVADSIWMSGLAPGASVDLSVYPRQIYGTTPTGPCAIGCFVDRDDKIAETDETDNYIFIGGYQVY